MTTLSIEALLQTPPKQEVANTNENFLVAVFNALLNMTNSIQNLVLTGAEYLNNNASTVTDKDNQIQGLQEVVVPSNASSAQINQADAINQNIVFQRQNLEGQVTVLRNIGTQESTVEQVNSNNLESCGAAASAFLAVMKQVMQLITRISGQQ